MTEKDAAEKKAKEALRKDIENTTKKRVKFDHRIINEPTQVIPAVNAIIEFLKGL